MQVMQLLRQGVAFSAARVQGGCWAKAPNATAFEHHIKSVAQPSQCSGIAQKHLLNLHYAQASQMNGLGSSSPSIHPFPLHLYV